MLFTPWGPELLPIGGIEIDVPGAAEDLFDRADESQSGEEATWISELMPTFALALSLAGTIALMIPVTWVYMSTKRRMGYRKTFVAALILLPICATSIVLLIQDSLALAFGLAALVAAVRFRVSLNDALDGIYIFAAICVGLAAGVGYLGVGSIMTVFYCFSAIFLWHLNYGANPLDDARQERKLEGLKQEQAAQRPAD
jgi:hypothetical protein